MAHRVGHSKTKTTKNIYRHLYAWDRASIPDAKNQAAACTPTKSPAAGLPGAASCRTMGGGLGR